MKRNRYNFFSRKPPSLMRSLAVKTWRTIIAVLLFFTLISDAFACPGVIFIHEMNPRLSGPRTAVRLFVWKGQIPTEIAVQVDPVDDDGHFIFFADATWRHQPLADNDLIIVRPEDFGRRMERRRESLPCHGPVIYELVDPSTNQFAYLTVCEQAPSPQTMKASLDFDPKGHKIYSSRYFYRFNPDNYMQFDEIGFAAIGGWQKVAERSELLIRADVKNFFNMNFDSDDIESELEDSRSGTVGHLARVSFFLRLLLFKIRMSLSTDVAFYEDSGHIPMMVTLPVNAFEYLHPGSGILYSWTPVGKARHAMPRINMPPLRLEDVKKGFQALGRQGLKHCQGERCIYDFGVVVDGRNLVMNFHIRRSLVEKGFFPQYVDNVVAHSKAMGWQVDAKKAMNRIGLYFEVSGLPAGTHPWDFWLRLGDRHDSSGSCPRALNFSKIRDNPRRFGD